LFGLVSLHLFVRGGPGPDPIPSVEKTRPLPFDRRRIPSIIDAVLAHGVKKIRAVQIEAVTKKKAAVGGL
jgi:hypothetical protein